MRFRRYEADATTTVRTLKPFRELCSHTSYFCSHGKLDQYFLAPGCGCQLRSACKIDFFLFCCVVQNTHRLVIRNERTTDLKARLCSCRCVVRFEVLMAVTLKIILWDVTPCGLVEGTDM
jgi:hypothetical protein